MPTPPFSTDLPLRANGFDRESMQIPGEWKIMKSPTLKVYGLLIFTNHEVPSENNALFKKKKIHLPININKSHLLE